MRCVALSSPAPTRTRTFFSEVVPIKWARLGGRADYDARGVATLAFEPLARMRAQFELGDKPV